METENKIESSILTNVDDILLSEGRTLYIGEDIEYENMNELNKKIIYLYLKNPKNMITIYINSAGGDLLAALSVCDVISSLKVPVKTVALGECKSAALFILASGTYGMRYATKNCVFMTHRIKRYTTREFDSDEMFLKYKDFLKIEKMTLNILSKYRKENKKIFKEIYDSKIDHIFYSKEAKHYKIIDKII